MSDGTLCPWCGAYSPRSCELEDEMGCCPWSESGEYESEASLPDDGQSYAYTAPREHRSIFAAVA